MVGVDQFRAQFAVDIHQCTGWISTSALGGYPPVHWVDIQSPASIPAAHSNVVAGCGPGKWFPQVFGICLNRVF